MIDLCFCGGVVQLENFSSKLINVVSETLEQNSKLKRQHYRKIKATSHLRVTVLALIMKSIQLLTTITLAMSLPTGATSFQDTQDHRLRLDFGSSRIAFRTDPKFLSFAIDSSNIQRGLAEMKLTDPTLIALTKHLSPAYLRIGGTASDRLLFSLNNTPPAGVDGHKNTSYFTGDDWLTLHKFVQQTNTRLLFDLNALFRKPKSTSTKPDSTRRKSTKPTSNEKEQKSTKQNSNEQDISKQTANEQKSTKPNFKEQNTTIQTSKPKTIGENQHDLKEPNQEVHKTGNKVANLGFTNLGFGNVEDSNEDIWDSSNAEMLLTFCEQQGLSNDWQLGNEPNIYQSKFNRTVSPAQLARDFQRFKFLLALTSFHRNSLLIGPDVSRPSPKLCSGQGHGDLCGPDVSRPLAKMCSRGDRCGRLDNMKADKYLDQFLGGGGADTLSRVSFHQYYLNRSDNISAYLNPDTFDLLTYQITKMKNITAKHYENHVELPPLWLGLTDTFAASFLWIDKLGLAARLGVSVVVRQSLEFGNYSLLDWNTLEPNPDWWLSVLYKRLVDPRVLNISVPLSHRTLRLYVQCSPAHNITVFGINSGNYYERLYFNVDCTVYLYSIKSCDGDLTTKEICLNETPLRLNSDSSLPPLTPVKLHLSHEKNIVIPPETIVFMEIFHNTTQVCDPM
ncbi:hypothetical protein M8J75_012415 [Diaphorina citri]|nr:hypothetical protein M8J75_012415 [Diaphorina citri]